MRIEIRPPTEADAIQLGESMKPDDARECDAWGYGPVAAALHSLKYSHLTTALAFDDQVVALAGLRLEVPTSALVLPSAQVWLLTSTHLDRAPRALHRLGKEYVAGASRYASHLWNYVDSRHETALRWLSFLGFSIRRHAIESSGVWFHHVSRRL